MLPLTVRGLGLYVPRRSVGLRISHTKSNCIADVCMIPDVFFTKQRLVYFKLNSAFQLTICLRGGRSNHHHHGFSSAGTYWTNTYLQNSTIKPNSTVSNYLVLKVAKHARDLSTLLSQGAGCSYLESHCDCYGWTT